MAPRLLPATGEYSGVSTRLRASPLERGACPNCSPAPLRWPHPAWRVSTDVTCVPPIRPLSVPPQEALHPAERFFYLFVGCRVRASHVAGSGCAKRRPRTYRHLFLFQQPFGDPGVVPPAAPCPGR